MVLFKGKTQEVENYANIETQKLAKRATNNKITFNDQKSKIMVITRKNPRRDESSKFFLIINHYNKKIR
jgi:hypothetical protein